MTVIKVGILFQIRPSVTTIVPALTASSSTSIVRIWVCAPGADGANYALFQRNGPGAIDEDNALVAGRRVAARGDDVIEANDPNTGIGLQPGDQFAVQTTVAGALVFTVYGVTSTPAYGEGIAR